jgi:predicted methyltransferase
MITRRRILSATSLAFGAAGAMAAAPALAQLPLNSDAVLEDVIDNGPRSPDDKARDVYRHPYASLVFWGLKPGMTVIDVQPGSGWWTEIIAPYLKRTGGRYIAALAERGQAAFAARYAAKPDVFGTITLVDFGPTSGPLAPPGSVDLVLVSREIHNWAMRDGFTEKAFADFRAALKPQGILAVEEHRASPGADPRKGNGYLPEAWMIDKAQGAGFTLAARSEINANPKDTKDYPFGVWTLPPTRLSAPQGQRPNPAFDHAQYDASGESDRMTLRFVKT